MIRIILSLSLLLIIGCNNDEEKPGPITAADSSNGNKTQVQEPSPNIYAPVDISPMDMSYYPVEYPKLKMTDSITTPPLARVIYSRPHLGGRQLFKDVLKHGEPWRLGANEATELELFKDVTVQGKKIRSGRYILYAIPDTNKWTIVINSNIDNWGLKPNPSKDIARFEVPLARTANHLEYFTMVFEEKGNNVDLVMAWDNLETRLPIRF
jgi:hypothetical protein